MIDLVRVLGLSNFIKHNINWAFIQVFKPRFTNLHSLHRWLQFTQFISNNKMNQTNKFNVGLKILKKKKIASKKSLKN